MREVTMDLPRSELEQVLAQQGYTDLVLLNGSLCGLFNFNFNFNFTVGIVVGMTLDSYERRYCFEHEEQARAALQAWDGKGHPGGPWIKCKGARIDLLNPALFSPDGLSRNFDTSKKTRRKGCANAN